MQAMILAAGFGTRLLPHTLIRPKPLFPILNTPLLLLTIDRLKAAGFEHIIVNCHHLREQVSAALAEMKGVVVQEEEVILGTGGGLRKAMAVMRDEPLLVTNGDIYHTIDFGSFYTHHKCVGAASEAGAGVTLAVHNYPRFNSVLVRDGRVAHFDDRDVAKGELLAFTGLHVIDPELLADIPDGEYSCIIDRYRRLLQEGVTLNYYRTDDCYWTDMGTPEAYLDLHQGLCSGRIPRWSQMTVPREKLVVDRGASIGRDVQVDEWAVVGKARIGDSCVLKGSVVWDGVEIPAGTSITDAILSSNDAQ